MSALHLTKGEGRQLHRLLTGVNDTVEARSMRNYMQHGRISTYQHCLSVARMSFYLNRRWHVHADEASLVRAAFLHDFYLYDWHHCKHICHFHGFQHPVIALENADKHFDLNPRERNAIRSHMWPMTILALPRCREAFLVCLADKICAFHETFFKR